jgi:hypothetical protein
VIRRIAMVGLVVAASLNTIVTVVGASASSSAHSSAVTRTETVIREQLSGATETVVDRRTITLKVSQTQNLRGRQVISVSWSGAHPTSGIVADQNSIEAQQEEYPFILLECRDVNNTAKSAADRVVPQTCWTQDWSERYQDTFQSPYPAYRLDQFAGAAGQSATAYAPSMLPKACNYLPAPIQHWVPFIAADGTTYNEGPAGCAGQPPESQNVGGSALPSNETFGVTGLDGRGSTQFDVWTNTQNASLGCSQSVHCSLVAVPIMGISCDPSIMSSSSNPPDPTTQAQATAACDANGAFAPGQLVIPQGQENLTVSGSLWWSASNWRNRIVVPLGFTTPADVCNVVSAKNSIDIYGSELMIQATAQWEPHFCLNSKLFSFSHVQTGEPEARNLLATGQSEAALVSEAPPGGYSRPVTSAPVALSGFAISYAIDDANGQPYTHLRLTARLLAKLLTESYPAVLPVKQEFSALSNNPLNITLDPEFIALNPGITQGVVASQAASELLALSSNSDVMHALTTYINDNAAARAWLDGAPDPWGMVVNPAYKGIVLPVTKWPLLSDFEPVKYYASDNNDCLFRSPVPFLPLVAAPMSTLENITEAMQFSIANSTTQCSQIDGTTLGEKLVAQGRQTVGFRFMIGVTPLADDDLYGLRAAALETNHGSFVAPSESSLRATARLLRPDVATGTWPIPYREIATSSDAQNAYPGTMLVYAAVATSGIPALDANEFAALIRFAVTSGQTPGYGIGQLPPGYLPLTAANGLGLLERYSLSAASDVAAQIGQVPNIETGNNVTTTTTPSTTSTTSAPTTTLHFGPVALGKTPFLAVSSGTHFVLVLLALAVLMALVTIAASARRREARQ